MCDIGTPTKLKQKTVYKVAWLTKSKKYPKGKYYSVFSQHELRVGKVVTFPYVMKVRSAHMFGYVHPSLKHGSYLFNDLMLGRVSGFALKSDAMIMVLGERNTGSFINTGLDKGNDIVVLKIVLKGSILQGTAVSISNHIPHDHITYAGDYIKSMEEIYLTSSKIKS